MSRRRNGAGSTLLVLSTLGAIGWLISRKVRAQPPSPSTGGLPVTTMYRGWRIDVLWEPSSGNYYWDANVADYAGPPPSHALQGHRSTMYDANTDAKAAVDAWIEAHPLG